MEQRNVVGLDVEEKRVPTAPASSAAMSADPTRTETREGDDRNRVFQKLVTTDDDVGGLVAYALYKQNKLDWLLEYEKLRGQAPSLSEIAAYIIGESTPRRLATYRHLAETTLAGSTATDRTSTNRAGALTSRESPNSNLFGSGSLSFLMQVAVGLLAIVGLIAIVLAARFGLGVK